MMLRLTVKSATGDLRTADLNALILLPACVMIITPSRDNDGLQ